MNEKFALSLLFQASGYCDENATCYKEDKQELLKTIEQVLYHLKYRNTNPQTLELFLIAMENGKKMHFAAV